MNRLNHFRLKFKDPVVAYYFIPGHSDVRLTVRFDQVFIHKQVYDPESENFVWRQHGPTFKNLQAAENVALSLVSNSARYQSNAKTPQTIVSESRILYRVA